MSAERSQQQHEIYERARLARDARFDGQFYIGVKTTGIYCRPICPANAPKSENVEFYPSAAAASEAGFRPCLRCRPECAPGTPAWSGTSTTVRRGLRLIAGGALDDGNVERLAERLGVTSRHMRRLFTHHLGASPLAVAHTQRLHFAKRLIDETDLSMQHIAGAAGYGSVRRFNDAFKNTYGRSPRELRKAGEPERVNDAAAPLNVRLPYRQPFDWHAQLRFWADRATPGVETVVDDTYWRTLSIDGEHAVISVRPAQQDGYLSLGLQGVDTSRLFEIVQSAREVFDLDAPIAEIASVLAADDVLQKALRANPGVRVPGAWDGFELTVRAVLGQQISVKAATTLAGRIAARYGEPLQLKYPEASVNLARIFPTPDKLRRARLNNMGLVTSRAETIRRIAAVVADGQLTFDAAQEPQDFVATLKSIRGVGDWTAQYVAMRALKNPDAFPASDLGLLKSIDRSQRVTPANLEQRAESWRPWRAYAALLLWGSLAGSGG
ncbi:MAG: helix-turn-helix domain-containing protein [Gammaproteobacteria bacterium]|nr:helix-turn-helix domain-containing protein [Gammaproteobacteria bacterium]